jgi:hypothetical protein
MVSKEYTHTVKDMVPRVRLLADRLAADLAEENVNPHEGILACFLLATRILDVSTPFLGMNKNLGGAEKMMTTMFEAMSGQLREMGWRYSNEK